MRRACTPRFLGIILKEVTFFFFLVLFSECPCKKRLRLSIPFLFLIIMLRYKHVLQQQYRPCLNRCFVTKVSPEVISEDLKPVKSIEDKDGITEVYIVRRTDGKKKSLATRLKTLTENNQKDTEETKKAKVSNTEIKQGDQKWTNISNQAQYERKRSTWTWKHLDLDTVF